MKYKLIIAVAFLGLAMSSCKKEEYVTITNNGTEVTPNSKENYDHTNYYISTNKWKITPLFGSAGKVLIWKLNVEGTNNFLIINPVDDSIYYKDEYKEGKFIEGALVLTLSIKHP